MLSAQFSGQVVLPKADVCGTLYKRGVTDNAVVRPASLVFFGVASRSSCADSWNYVLSDREDRCDLARTKVNQSDQLESQPCHPTSMLRFYRISTYENFEKSILWHFVHATCDATRFYTTFKFTPLFYGSWYQTSKHASGSVSESLNPSLKPRILPTTELIFLSI